MAMWHCEMNASSLSGLARVARFYPGNSLKMKRIAVQGCMERPNALYDGTNMHMIEKQSRPPPGAPLGQA
jgi:hypothetical protein